MSKADTPDDGDFSRLIEQKQSEASHIVLDVLAATHPTFGPAPFDASGLSAELTEEIAALHEAPPLSDDELESQALADGCADDFDEEVAAPEPTSTTILPEPEDDADPLAFDQPNFVTAVLEVAHLSAELEAEIAVLREVPFSDDELERQALAVTNPDPAASN